MIRRLILILPFVIGIAHAQEAPDEAYTDFMQAAESAEKLADPLQRCLQYPDLPGNTWSPELAKARCLAFNTPPPFTLDALEVVLKAGNGAKQLDARFREMLQRRDAIFLALAPFKSTARDADAFRIASAWVKASPDSPFAQTALGLVLANRGWNARGTDYARNVSDASFKSMDAWFEEAKAQFESALQHEPRMVVACESLMAIGRQTSQALQASARSRCLEADPASFFVVEEMMNDAEPRWGGSLAQMREVAAYARSQMAANPVLEVLVLNPDAYPGFVSRDDQAVIAGLEPVALRAPNPGYIGPVGCTLARSEDVQVQRKAMTWLSESLRFQPDGQCALMYRAKLHFQFGQLDRALVDAEHGLSLDPGNTWLHSMTATLLRLHNRTADALPHYQALMADPEYRANATFEYCTVMIEMARWEEARACSDALTKLDPFDGNYWDLRLKALQTYDAPGAEEAMRQFLVYKDANYWPWHAETERKVRAWMTEHHMEE